MILSGLMSTVVSLHAAVIKSASASYSDVSAAVVASRPGDTILIPPDTALWRNMLIVRHGLHLQGAGETMTRIIAETANEPPYATIIYQPDRPAENDLFEISGMAFDLQNRYQAVNLRNDADEPITKIKIHDNTFINCGPTAVISENSSLVYGVIYDNTFSANPGRGVYLQLTGNGYWPWRNLAVEYGDANALYIEDNTILASDDTFIGSSRGIRYVARFNTFLHIGTNSLSPWFDAHGNQPDDLSAVQRCEIYFNKLIDPERRVGVMFDHRGGKALFFFNTISSDLLPVIYCREEYADDICDYGSYIGPNPPQIPQHVSDSYYFENRNGDGTLIDGFEGYDCCDVLQENSEFWSQKANFDGTAGMGVGPFDKIPARCNKGVAYWAVDKGGNWNLNNKTENDGALYKATSANRWELCYIPYIYPHPLRSLEPPKNLKFIE